MKKKWIQNGIATVTATTLLVGTVALFPTGGPVSAAAATTQATASLASKIVKLNASSTLYIRDVNFLMQDKGKVLAFSVAITNNGSSPLDLMDYWLRVKSKSGKTFKAVVVEGDKEKQSVAPKSTTYVTYYAVVDTPTQLKDLSFNVIKWDFTVANYERTLGTIQYPANSTDQVAAFKDKVMLINNGKIRGAVKQTLITKDATNGYLTVNFLLENVGQQAIDISKLNFFVQTQGLSVYSVTSSSTDQTMLQPKERKIITLRATLPVAVAGKPLSFVVAQNDEASKVLLGAGNFALPAAATLSATPVGKTRSIFLGGTTINTQAGSAFVTQGATKNEISLEYKMTNSGAQDIKFPALDFFIVTKSGTSYPLSYTKEENASILPGIENTITLSGSLPSTVKVEESQLVMKSTATEKEKSYVISNYLIRTASQQGGVGSSFAYNDYGIKLNSIDRSPYEDNDMLVANLTITNNSDVTKQIPSLGGYFMVNGVKVGTEKKAVALDNAITIAPGASAEFIVNTEIPYTTTFNNITFVSTEPVQDKAGKQLYQFTGQRINEASLASSETPYVISNVGKKSSTKILRTAVFTGELKNNFYAEFEVTNNESRAALISKLGGYIKDKNGIVVPIQFAEVKEKVSPGSKVLLSAWAAISKSFDTSSYSLYLGQAYTDNTSAGGGTPTTGGENTVTAATSIVVKPVAYSVSSSAPATKTELRNVNFAGYVLDLYRINAYLDVAGEFSVNGLKMVMDYTLKKDAQYEYIAGDHKVMFEFVNDDDQKVTYSKQFALTSAASGEEWLKEAITSPLSMVFQDSAIQSRITKYDNYTVNVYDVFQNTKLLVASKKLRWFSVNP
ncbi:hypothetical protein [Paenibacillus xanthanilyticus]|uniref:Uncharacterized protein n=1 Tax=Paenibacillus xanthanilyticus TaxID=1783531 RepID=A0ABV8K2Z3_9BACL